MKNTRHSRQVNIKKIAMADRAQDGIPSIHIHKHIHILKWFRHMGKTIQCYAFYKINWAAC